jgi:hypothetical protein
LTNRASELTAGETHIGKETIINGGQYRKIPPDLKLKPDPIDKMGNYRRTGSKRGGNRRAGETIALGSLRQWLVHEHASWS